MAHRMSVTGAIIYGYSVLPMSVALALWTFHMDHLYYVCMMAIAPDVYQICIRYSYSIQPMSVALALWTFHMDHLYYVCMMAIAIDLYKISIRYSYSILPMCVAHALWTLHGHHLYYICMRPIATDLLRLHDGYRNRSPSDTASYVCCACIMDTPWSPPSLLRLHEGYRNRSPSDTGIPSFLCMLRMHYGHSMVTTISTTFA